MTVVPAQQGGSGGTSGLYDVLELVLDRGLVIDAFVRVSLVGIEILKIDIRVVVASVDTYLRFAEACNRLDLEAYRTAIRVCPTWWARSRNPARAASPRERSRAPRRPSPTRSRRPARRGSRSPSRVLGAPPRAGRRSRNEHLRLRHSP